jgi:hypothetical protein
MQSKPVDNASRVPIYWELTCPSGNYVDLPSEWAVWAFARFPVKRAEERG